jgi:hypothetical protein
VTAAYGFAIIMATGISFPFDGRCHAHTVDEGTATSSPGFISSSIRRPFVGEGFHLAED